MRLSHFSTKISVSYMLIDELKRFLGEIKTGNSTVSNSEITTFSSELFSLFVNLFYHRLNITKLFLFDVN